MNDLDTRKFRFEKSLPEGGWGYLIGVGMALPFVSKNIHQFLTFQVVNLLFSFKICALSSMPSFGLMFNDFLTSLGEGTSAVTLITSTYFCAQSFAGLFTNTLFKRFSIRAVGVFGGSIYFIGSLMTVFVTSMEQLLFTFSFLQGIFYFKMKY